MLANLPGDLDDFVYVLMDEFENNEITALESVFGEKMEDLIRKLNFHSFQCSNYGV